MVFAGRSVLERKTVAEAVAEKLRMRILSGALQEGAQLRQEVLAAELGVSRIPLREALRLLEGEGLVTIVPHRGAVVSVRSPDEIGELFDLRVLLEPGSDPPRGPAYGGPRSARGRRHLWPATRRPSSSAMSRPGAG